MNTHGGTCIVESGRTIQEQHESTGFHDAVLRKVRKTRGPRNVSTVVYPAQTPLGLRSFPFPVLSHYISDNIGQFMWHSTKRQSCPSVHEPISSEQISELTHTCWGPLTDSHISVTHYSVSKVWDASWMSQVANLQRIQFDPIFFFFATRHA